MEHTKILQVAYCPSRERMWIVVTNESFDKIVIVMSWNSSLSIDGDSFERERMIMLCTGSMIPRMRRVTIAMHAILFIVVVCSV